MSALETYYDIPKTLLTVIGLWPYERPKFIPVQNIVVILIIVSTIVPQCLVFVSSIVTIQLLLKSMSPIVMSSGVILQYVAFWYQNDKVKEFLDRVQQHWKTNDREALDILKKQTEIGRYYAKLFTLFIYPSALILIILDMSNYVVHVIAPSNGTHIFQFPVTMEYCIDQKKHYFLIIVHQCVSVFVIATVYAATETFHIMLLEHAAGLFAITNNRIERAVVQDTANFDNNDKSFANESKVTMITAINLHRRAMRFARALRNTNTVLYSILVVLGVLSLSASFYRLSLSLFNTSQIEESLTALLFSISMLAYMFFMNYVIQQLLDSAMNVVPMLYETPWYDASIGIQKLLLIVMLKASEEFTIVYCAVFQASIEGFSLLLKNSVSGLMIMTSLQER